MIKLYLVRHGQTIYNLEGRIQGHKDSELSETGILQAKYTAKRLADVEFKAIYSSDLQRAKRTAEIIAEPHNLEVICSTLIREACYGVIEGLTREEIEKKYPQQSCEWRKNPQTMRPPGAESLESLILRCSSFIDNIMHSYTLPCNICIVGHIGSLRSIALSVCHLPVEYFKIFKFDNSGLSIIEAGKEPSINLLNDTSHLKGLIAKDMDADLGILSNEKTNNYSHNIKR